MSANLTKYTFRELIANMGTICIPRIQRGYAQGRETKKIEGIRKDFLHSLFLVIDGKQPEIELDFVYGSNNDNSFEPLDGQQRLTTLFLIHWILGENLKQPQDGQKSVFSYASCSTSEEFTNALVQREAASIIKDVKNQTGNHTHKDGKETTISTIIRKKDWFQWQWKYDPSITSMLNMLDAIYMELSKIINWEENRSQLSKNLDNIKFNLLDLGTFGYSHDLFIKMNARGKHLSDFDLLKSSLEEELQIQRYEKNENGDFLETHVTEKNWRTLMDGTWSDFFWRKYANQIMIDNPISGEKLSDEEIKRRENNRLNAAKRVEQQFKTLLLRLIGIHLISQKKCDEDLKKACYEKNEPALNQIIPAYLDSIVKIRSHQNIDSRTVPDTVAVIPFSRIINDINGMLYFDENNICQDIFSRIPEECNIDKSQTILDSFLSETLPNDSALVFFAAIEYLKEFPMPREKKINELGFDWSLNESLGKLWISNFSYWMKSMRNILLNDNNNSRIDKIEKYDEAIEGVQSLTKKMRDFATKNNLYPDNIKNFVPLFFKSMDEEIESNNVSFRDFKLDNQSMKEECDKAKLIIQDENWSDVISKYEQHDYLWGQIRSLLHWSDNNIDTFKNYATKIEKILDYITTPANANKYYIALLNLTAGFGLNDNNRLYILNKDRDYSIKRYLRDAKSGYGIAIKNLIDVWTKEYDSVVTVDEFLSKVINSHNSSEIWIKCLTKDSDILDYSYSKCIFEEKGHVILSQRRTQNSHCIDIILKYLENLAIKNDKKSDCTLDDSKGDYSHGFSISTLEGQYVVRWADETPMNYKVQLDGGDAQEYSPEELLAFLEPIISNKQ